MVKVWVEDKNNGTDSDDIIGTMVKEYINVNDVISGDKDVMALTNGDTFGFSILELVRLLKVSKFKMPLQDLFDVIQTIYENDLVRFQ